MHDPAGLREPTWVAFTRLAIFSFMPRSTSPRPANSSLLAHAKRTVLGGRGRHSQRLGQVAASWRTSYPRRGEQLLNTTNGHGHSAIGRWPDRLAAIRKGRPLPPACVDEAPKTIPTLRRHCATGTYSHTNPASHTGKTETNKPGGSPGPFPAASMFQSWKAPAVKKLGSET